MALQTIFKIKIDACSMKEAAAIVTSEMNRDEDDFLNSHRGTIIKNAWIQNVTMSSPDGREL
jgi:hypothetical protein